MDTGLHPVPKPYYFRVCAATPSSYYSNSDLVLQLRKKVLKFFSSSVASVVIVDNWNGSQEDETTAKTRLPERSKRLYEEYVAKAIKKRAARERTRALCGNYPPKKL